MLDQITTALSHPFVKATFWCDFLSLSYFFDLTVLIMAFYTGISLWNWSVSIYVCESKQGFLGYKLCYNP